MDALQQPQRFMRAPSPSPMSSDLQQPRPPPPPPPQTPWYPNQFQYHSSHPPPHHQSMWPDHHHQQQQPISTSSSSSYPIPQQHNHVPPYPTHPPPQPQAHYLHPPPPPSQHPPYAHPSYPQTYPQPNTHQSWGSSNWTHRQGWEYPDRNNPNNNEEDWAAKARAWAAAKSAMDDQNQQLQFTHIGRPEEYNHGYQDQYQRAVNPHYADILQPSLSASSHQQYSVSIGDPHRLPSNHLQESSSFSSGPSSSYASDLHVSYATRDGAPAANPSPVFPHQGIITTNSNVYQQEVPSSYSSIPGNGEVGGQNVRLHTPSPLPISSAQEGKHHVQPTLSASGRSVPGEQPYFTYGDRSADSVTDLSDRPLDFAPGFNRNHDSHDQHTQSSYRHPDPAGPLGYVDHVAAVPPIPALTPPVVPGMGYPPSGLQFDPSFAAPLPMFGQIPGPNFRPPIPTGSVPFGLAAAAFPGDPNGISNISDRPKKASVPNWLREEIKKKAVIASSSQEHLEVDPSNHTEDEDVEKSFIKGGQVDSKSIDSSRSSDDEDDNEDDIEEARTAAINLEIKRVLTEVLLKVTDELFDEIATKVLNEDDLAVEVDHGIPPPNQKLSPSPPAVPTPKASAKVLLSVKTKETESGDASGKSTSGLPGDVLGLASYASDDDDYDEIQSSSKSSTRRMDVHLHANNKLSEDIPSVVENGGSQEKTKGSSGTNMVNDQDETGLTEALNNPSAMNKELGENVLDKDLNNEKGSLSTSHKGDRDTVSQEGTLCADGGNLVEATDGLKSKEDVGGKSSLKFYLPQGDVGKKLTTDASQARQARSKSDKNDGHESKRSSSGKDFLKEEETGNIKADKKHSDASEPRRDERHARKEKTDDRNGLERMKDQGTKPGEKARESDSRRSSSFKDKKTETEKVKKDDNKYDSSRKRVRERNEKEDRSRHQAARDSSNRKRRHSPSVGGRVRNSKENSVGSHANESSDEASEDSRRRKKHSRKHSLSPSPPGSRRRQVSRSPHSKHSHRRHSPYSSLETKRGRRSRSNSPARRRR